MDLLLYPIVKVFNVAQPLFRSQSTGPSTRILYVYVQTSLEFVFFYIYLFTKSGEQAERTLVIVMMKI